MRRRGRASAGLVIAVLLAVSPAAGQAGLGSPHGELPEGLACVDCHTTEAWSPLRADRSFDHAAYGGFVLDGRHDGVACAGCHEGLSFAAPPGADEGCAGCHVDVHRGAITRPCEACHGTESFQDLDFGIVHPADFPLEGAHLQTSCESCHRDDLGGAFAPLDRECATCHMGDYLSSTLVDHQQLGYSTDCTECHSTLDFRDVAFDHFTISGGFELTGAHTGVECTSCHRLPDGGVPQAPSGPEDCVACHLDDYQEEHGGSGFPRDCLACHNGFDWEGVDFDHAFQIFSGPHSEVWNDCAECHVTPGDFGDFTCLTCHGQADMDDRHSEEPGYAYDSPTCLSCHPTGRKG